MWWIPILLKPPKFKNNLRLVSNLPCLPVPELKHTLEKLLLSAKPFLTQQELCQGEDLLKEFCCPQGVGEFLQCKLKERAEHKENWLKDWWQHWAYLDNRSSVVTTTSAGISFPLKNFETEDDMLLHAAKIVAGALEFKNLCDENKITRESFGCDPVDMGQYKQVFGSTRIPCCPEDYLICCPGSDYIIVLYHNIFYKVIVKDGLSWMKQHAIHLQLKEIASEKCKVFPVGVLTADSRDIWNTAYDQLRKNSVSCETIKAIEGALFILCLDSEHPADKTNKATTCLGQCFHGGGPSINGSNRWFDKTVQFIVGRCGTAGVCYEPSVAEVDVMIGIMDYINSRMDKTIGSMPSSKTPEKLIFDLEQSSITSICLAECRFERLVCDLELVCFKFVSYGKNTLKDLQLSPDSFIQMSLQLTSYKIFGRVVPQFEIASTRKFKGGRNEAIRTCSEDTVRFVEAFCDPCMPTKQKKEALLCALNAHLNLVKAAMSGQGIDRHLLGLSMVAYENKMCMPRLFSHPIYMKSSKMQLYTYQMNCKFDGYMANGPMVRDGYSCFYNIRPEDINFSITACASSTTTNASLFADTLNCVLKEMRDLLIQESS